MGIFYRIITFLFWIINRIGFLGVKVTKIGKTKYDGNIILVSNHQSSWDPLFIAPELRMEIHFFAKAELFKNKILAYIFNKGLKAFPVKRGQADMGAIKYALGVLKDDHCLGVFPEGTRYKGQMGPFQRGFASIALKTKSKIIPVYVDGDYRLFRKMHLIIGQPVDFSDQVDIKDRNAPQIYADLVKEELLRLKKEYGIYND